MYSEPVRSPWPKLLWIALAALLALDAAVLATAASIPAVREQARRFAPAFGSLIAAAGSRALAQLPTTPTESQSSYILTCDEGVSGYAFSSGRGEDEGFQYLYAEPSGKSGDDWNMSGTFNDSRMHWLRKERVSFVWFRAEDGECVVKDPALVAQAREISAPVREMGAEMGRVGALQGKVGAKQGQLGARQGALGARIGALAARRATVALAGDDDAGERLNNEIEGLQRELERLSAELGAQMRPLSAEQERLGRIQAGLGQKQAGLVEIEARKMRNLLEQAKRQGKAVRQHAEA